MMRPGQGSPVVHHYEQNHSLRTDKRPPRDCRGPGAHFNPVACPIDNAVDHRSGGDRTTGADASGDGRNPGPRRADGNGIDDHTLGVARSGHDRNSGDADCPNDAYPGSEVSLDRDPDGRDAARRSAGPDCNGPGCFGSGSRADGDRAIAGTGCCDRRRQDLQARAGPCRDGETGQWARRDPADRRGRAGFTGARRRGLRPIAQAQA